MKEGYMKNKELVQVKEELSNSIEKEVLDYYLNNEDCEDCAGCNKCVDMDYYRQHCINKEKRNDIY